ncbi:hypothetical protein [Leptodesmis sichuanensis]|uniref:hypothetical protein n=1 Tax=Leptodesmis sichuanensis TaxID=2906798 RepID=UPI001F2B914E|nr:hypothetical protein [Leptodesmis sichuanensis]UIE36159.1 hypothetical protein KIK02_13840 [Leptodesmis sichuanensis A121]
MLKVTVELPLMNRPILPHSLSAIPHAQVVQHQRDRSLTSLIGGLLGNVVPFFLGISQP